MELNNFSNYFSTPTSGDGDMVLNCHYQTNQAAMLKIAKEIKMKMILTISLTLLSAFSIISCQSKDQLSVKTAQEKIVSSINNDLAQAGADMALSQVKLKKAPKASGYTWVGTAAFASGSGKFEQEITVLYENDDKSLIWWYSDNPEEVFNISFGDSSGQPTQNNEPRQTEQTVQNTGNTQEVVNLGKVEQKGTTFTTFNTAEREITHFSSPNMQLVGWGRDFFVIRSGTTFKTYDARCKELSSNSIGGATTTTVEADTFTVKVGSSSQKYDRRGKRK